MVASGFCVDYYFPNKFYISWDFEEIKQKKNEVKKQIPLSTLSTLSIPQQSKLSKSSSHVLLQQNQTSGQPFITNQQTQQTPQTQTQQAVQTNAQTTSNVQENVKKVISKYYRR